MTSISLRQYSVLKMSSIKNLLEITPVLKILIPNYQLSQISCNNLKYVLHLQHQSPTWICFANKIYIRSTTNKNICISRMKMSFSNASL